MSFVVQRAIAALEAWSPDSPQTAAVLLDSWSARPELTDAERLEVLDYFAAAEDLRIRPCPQCAGEGCSHCDNTGVIYP